MSKPIYTYPIGRTLGYFLLCIVFVVNTAWAQNNNSNEPQKWQVNFKDSDIQEVIKFVADITEKTVIIDPRVKGRVKVISAEPLTKQALYDLFLSVLEIQGFTAIEIGGVLRIVPRKDARSTAGPTSNTPKLPNDAYITQVIQLYNVSAAKVLPVLRPLAPQHAHLAAYAPSNSIIVSDTVANIARLREIIRRLDRAGVAATEIVVLRYARAEEMVKILQTLQKTDAKDAPTNSRTEMVADTRSNSILITGDEVRRTRIKELIARLDVPTQRSGNVRVIYLEYADAEEVAKVLSKIVSNISKLEPEAGKSAAAGADKANVEADPSTNSLLITADGATLESLLPVIDRLDIRRAQVLVEGIIVEVSGDLDRQLGIEWAAFEEGKILAASLNTGALAAVAADVQAGAASRVAGLTGQTVGFGNVQNDGSGFNFIGLLRLLQSSSEANILSTPSLLTTDNNQASISIGDNVPFRTGSFTSTNGGATNPFQTIERKDIGIKLSVTPQISEGNTLVLDIEQEVSSVNPTTTNGAADLITSQRKINTQVIANDGETVVLGGLIRDEVQETRTKMPLLGDIPILGWLFRSDSTEVNKSNLMVFLRATIVRTAGELKGATAQKYRAIREEQLKRIEQGATLVKDDLLPLLPVWDEANTPGQGQ